jgi:cytochrome c biogenesis protein
MIRCEKFFVEFYDTGAPKEFRSELTFLDGNDVVLKGSLLVNHPITFRGITFYQSSYGPLPGGEVTLDISKNGDSSGNANVVVEAGDFAPIPGNGGQFKVADLKSDYMRLGPAALILIRSPKGEETRFWIFQNHDLIRQRMPEIFERFPRLNPAAYKPYTFSLRKIANKYYTGLQVSRDPGVPLVWLGCFMMVVGFIVAFFTSHQRIWVRLSKSKGKIRVSTAGRTNKNPVGLERELNQLTEKLRNTLVP